MSTPLVEPWVPRDSRGPALKHWPILVFLGCAQILLGMGTVQYGVGLAGTLIGGFGTAVALAWETVIALALAGWAVERSRSLVALLPGIAAPVLSFLWIYHSFCMPGTLPDGPRENAYGDMVGDYPAQLGAVGNVIVGLSMVSVQLTCWLFVDPRVRWYVRVPVALGVVIAHVMVVMWLRGRCGV